MQLLWLVGKPRLDTLFDCVEEDWKPLWLVGKPRLDTLDSR